MKNFRRGTLGEEADLKEFVNMLRKEFKEKGITCSRSFGREQDQPAAESFGASYKTTGDRGN